MSSQNLKKPFLFLMALIAASILYIYLKETPREKISVELPSDEIQSPVSSAASPRATPSSQSLQKMLNEPRLASNEKLTSHMNDVEENCLAFYSEILKIDLSLLDYPPKFESLPQSANCKKTTKELARLQTAYERNCGHLKKDPDLMRGSDMKWQKEIKLCQIYVYFLRAGISNWQSGDQPLSQIVDLRLLSDRLTSAFGKTYLGIENSNGRDLVAVGERMLEVDPRLYGAAKAVMMGHLAEGMSRITQKQDDAFWQRMEQDLTRLRGLNHDDDPQVLEVERMVRTRGFEPALVREEATRMIANNPHDAEGYHLLAYADWRQGHRDIALQNLRRALELNPSNLGYQETLRVLQTRRADENSFKLAVQFGLNLDEVLR